MTPQTKRAPHKHLCQTILWLGLCLTMCIVCLASVDMHADGEDAFLALPKFGIIAIPDTLAALTIMAVALVSRRGTLAPLTRNISLILATCAALVIVGALRGGAVDLPHVTGIGPEFRGLFFVCSIILMSYWIVAAMPGLATILSLLLCLSLIRCALELRVFGALTDGAHGMLSAMIVTAAQAYAVQKRGNTLWLLFPIGFVDFCLASGTRRTPILIALLGIALTAGTLAVARKSPPATRRLAIAFGTLLILGTVGLDRWVLEGALTERIATLDLEQSNVPDSSNWAHLLDVQQSYELALQAPLLGYGTGTELPGRYLSDAPVHSPHLHSWLRFGIAGLVAYVALQLYALFLLLKATMRVRPHESFRAERISLLLGLNAYLLAQWALPPFYLDYKRGLGIGVFLGAIFAFQAYDAARRRGIETAMSRAATQKSTSARHARLTT